MGVVRVLAACGATAAVAGTTLLAVGMGRAGADHGRVTSTEPLSGTVLRRAAPHDLAPSIPALRSSAAPDSSSAVPAATPPASGHSVSTPVSTRPAVRAATGTSVARNSTPATTPRKTVLPTAARTNAARTNVARTSVAPSVSRRTTTARASAPRTAAPAQARRTSARGAAPARATPRRGHDLPVGYSTGSATRVITVHAYTASNTTAFLQRWTKAAGGGWWRVGPRIVAHIGAQGMTRHPSESESATPMGSFTLTRAFGRYADPGTALPYRKTTPADWWISQSGPLYNTLQRCSSGCAFRQGAPNEHLYYETPYYNYAVVIDYNTRNAGPVRQGAGSAFFLHVSVGAATAGCVAIPSATLITVLRWLTPGTHPRMLIGAA